MARLPPNRASKHRHAATTSANNVSSSGASSNSFYSATNPTTERQASTPRRSQETMPEPQPLVPSTPQSRPSGCLTPLNLSAAINNVNQTNPTVTVGEDFMAKVEAFIERQEIHNNLLEQRITDEIEKGRESSSQAQCRSKRLPKELTGNVRDVYSNLTGANGNVLQWDFSKRLNDTENKAVNMAILVSVRSTDSTTPVSLIRAAIRAHFKTKKRKYRIIGNNQKKEVLKEQRKRSRKNTKRLKRTKMLRQSTSIPTEEKAKYLPVMTTDFMSSEDSVSENEDDANSNSSDSEAELVHTKRKKFCTKPLTWRSPELNTLMARLDRKISRRRSQKSLIMVTKRIQGPPSNRTAPEDAPEFAVVH